MARARKDGININYYIRRDVKERLDKYCEDVGQTATMAIERISVFLKIILISTTKIMILTRKKNNIATPRRQLHTGCFVNYKV